jgi:hypothetical protein
VTEAPGKRPTVSTQAVNFCINLTLTKANAYPTDRPTDTPLPHVVRTATEFEKSIMWTIPCSVSQPDIGRSVGRLVRERVVGVYRLSCRHKLTTMTRPRWYCTRTSRWAGDRRSTWFIERKCRREEDRLQASLYVCRSVSVILSTYLFTWPVSTPSFQLYAYCWPFSPFSSAKKSNAHALCQRKHLPIDAEPFSHLRGFTLLV